MATAENPKPSALQRGAQLSHAVAFSADEIPFVPAFDLLPKGLAPNAPGSQDSSVGGLCASDIAAVGAALWEVSNLTPVSQASRWLLAARMGGISNRY